MIQYDRHSEQFVFNHVDSLGNNDPLKYTNRFSCRLLLLLLKSHVHMETTPSVPY